MRRLIHLAGRFFESLRSRPLGPAEQAEATAWLGERESPLFWAQPPIDQRHALTAARIAASHRPHRRDLIRAALLHDIGKRHSRLGVAGRVIAAALELLHIPAPGRLGVYLRHDSLGAHELAELGVEPIVVSFAAGHHGTCPPDVDPDDWALLVRADGE